MSFSIVFTIHHLTLLGPFEVAKNAAQTSVLMSGSATDSSGRRKSGVIAAKNIGKLNSVGAVKQIVRNRGLGALFSGFKLHLARDTIGTGMYFSVYEATKQSIRSYQGADKANTQTAIAAAGFICGAGSWLCVRATHSASLLDNYTNADE